MRKEKLAKIIISSPRKAHSRKENISKGGHSTVTRGIIYISTALRHINRFVHVVSWVCSRHKRKEKTEDDKRYQESDQVNSTPCCCCLSCRVRARSARLRRRLFAYEPLISVPVYVGEVTLFAPYGMVEGAGMGGWGRHLADLGGRCGP
jgi:hypothetical protein